MTGDILVRLQAAQSDEEREWLVTEFSLANLESSVREAVWVAAIPHWFDLDYLAVLLDKSVDETRPIFDRLTSLSFIEPFPGRGYNIHERTRDLLLDRLWHQDRARFLGLSRRAVDFCTRKDQDETAWRVETIYHRLIVEPDEGAADMQNMGWAWQSSPSFAYDKVEAMARAGREHLDAGRLAGRSAGWILFWEAHLDIIYSRNHSAKQKLLAINVPADEDAWLAADCIKALGDVHLQVSEYLEARARYEEALPIYRAIDARVREANCIQALGDVHVQVSEYQEARARYEEALPIYRAIGVRVGEANCIQALGDVHIRIPENEEARARYEEALPVYRAIGDRVGEANCIKALGDIHFQLSEYHEARTRYGEALTIYRAIGARVGEANCIKALGDVHVRLTENQEARTRYEEALPIYRTIGARLSEANCIKALGDVRVRLSEYQKARVSYEEALPIYRAVGARVGEANCIKALGNVSLETGDEGAALAAYQDAFARFMALGLPNDAANALTSQTIIYDRRREYSSSLPLYTQVIEINPGNPMWLRNRALCYINLKDADHAVADLDMAARLQPDHPYLELRRGDVALLQREYGVAASHYQAFIGALPRNNGGYFGLARAYFGQHEIDNALASLTSALELTFRRQDVIDAVDDLIELQSDHPALSGIEQALEMLREWLARKGV